MTNSHVYFVGGPFSQWFTSPMTVADYLGSEVREYQTAEQFMMAQKALLFDDREVCEKILATAIPREQKELGRQVKDFDLARWQEHARNIVFRGNAAKFTQNEKLKETLLSTETRYMVEGAHYDEVWGVKLAWDDPRIEDRSNWRGTNWLGQCLMMVRQYVKQPTVVDEFIIYDEHYSAVQFPASVFETAS